MTTEEASLLESRIREDARHLGITHFSTGIVAARSPDSILLVRRELNDFMGGYYELPGGGVEKEESFESAAAREMREETGLSITGVLDMRVAFDYESQKHGTTRQINSIVQYEPGKIVLSNEHDDYRWAVKEDLDRLPLSAHMKSCLREAYQWLSQKTVRENLRLT